MPHPNPFVVVQIAVLVRSPCYRVQVNVEARQGMRFVSRYWFFERCTSQADDLARWSEGDRVFEKLTLESSGTH